MISRRGGLLHQMSRSSRGKPWTWPIWGSLPEWHQWKSTGEGLSYRQHLESKATGALGQLYLAVLVDDKAATVLTHHSPLQLSIPHTQDHISLLSWFFQHSSTCWSLLKMFLFLKYSVPMPNPLGKYKNSCTLHVRRTEFKSGLCPLVPVCLRVATYAVCDTGW